MSLYPIGIILGVGIVRILDDSASRGKEMC